MCEIYYKWTSIFPKTNEKNQIFWTKKAVNTGVSQAVPHLSTNPALSRLTSEFGWDLVHLE